MNKENLIEERKRGIGGSDIGAICGVNPYKKPIDVYLEKTGEEREVNNEAVKWGNKLEPIVLEETAQHVEHKIAVDVPVRAHDQYPFLIAHVDGLAMPDSKSVEKLGEKIAPYFMFDGKPVAVVEAKTAGHWSASQFGPSGSNELPETYILQGQHYMYVWGLELCIFGVLIAGQEFRLYRIERDDGLIEDMVIVAKDFWNHVEKREMPSADESESYARAIARLHQDTGEIITVDQNDEIAKHVQALREIRGLIEKYKAGKTAQENIIKEFLTKHNASGLELPGEFKLTWKKTKDSEKTDWKTVAKELAPLVPVEKWKEIIDKYTTTKEGTHRFLAKWRD